MTDREASLIRLIEIFHSIINEFKQNNTSGHSTPDYYLILASSAIIGKLLFNKKKHSALHVLNNYTVHQLNEVRKFNNQNSDNPNKKVVETTVEEMKRNRSEYIRYMDSDEFSDKHNLLDKLYGYGDYYVEDFNKIDDLILNITSTVENKISNVKFD